MSNVSRSIAQLRAEKEARLQRLEAGIALRQEAYQERLDYADADPLDQYLLAEKTLEKAARACALLEDAIFHDRALALGFKAEIHKDMGHITEALAHFREARQLFALAEPQIAEEYGQATLKSMKKISNDYLLDIGSTLRSANSLFEAEKCFLEALAMPELCPKSRVSCFDGLTSVYNKRKDWVRARQYCDEALKVLELLNVPSLADPEMRLRYHIFFLVQLGDAWEGQGDWARACQCDEEALTFWESQPTKGVYMSVLRRDGLALLREGKPLQAHKRMLYAVYLYKNQLGLEGINWTQLDDVLSAMTTIKVWAEACFLIPDADVIAYARKAFADVAETEAIMEAYREATLEETRREARKARGVTTTASGEQSTTTSGGKSKAAKRKQQKRKAQQQKKRAAEAAAAAERAAEEASVAAAEGASTSEQGGEARQAREEQQQEEIEHLAKATIGLALQGKQAAAEEDEAGGEEGEEEEEECSVCLWPLLGSEGGECRLVCKHAYHALCLELWQRNCVSKAIEPTCPYCRAPLQFEG